MSTYWTDDGRSDDGGGEGEDGEDTGFETPDPETILKENSTADEL